MGQWNMKKVTKRTMGTFLGQGIEEIKSATCWCIDETNNIQHYMKP